MGQLMYRINNQSGAVGNITTSIPALAQNVLTVVGMFVIVFTLHPPLALLAMTVVPFLYYSVVYYTRHIEGRILHVKGMEAHSLAMVHEAISMFRVIVAFGRERHEHRRFRSHAERTVDERVKLTVRQTLFSMAVNTTTALGTTLVLGFWCR